MFWKNFVDLCSKTGESPNAVAAIAGVKSSGTVTGWKKGAIPRDKVLFKIADHFGVDVSDLIGDGQKEKPPDGNGELTEKQKEAWELLKQMDNDTLEKFIRMAKVMLNK